MRLAAMSLALGAALALANTSPAVAVPAPGAVTNLIMDRDRCLDGSADGRATTHRCTRENPYQQWKWIAATSGFFQLQSQGTGLCLARVAGDEDYIAGIRCNQNDGNQIWGASGIGTNTTLFNRVNSRYLSKDTNNDLFFSDVIGSGWKTPVIG